MNNLLNLDILIYLNLGLIALVFALLVMVIALYFRIKKASMVREDATISDKKTQAELSLKISEAAVSRINEITQGSSVRVEESVRKFADEMARLAQEKSKEIGDFIEKQEQDQVKESQFFVANSLVKIEKEVEEYRQNKIEKVDEQIRQIVLSAAREVIGRAISLSEHEDLVSKALERAKKDQLFV